MNRILIEQSYVMQMSIHLQRFQWVPSVRAAKFRCPICGDSQKHQSKTRGYIFVNQTKRTHFNYKCHNCGYNNTFLYFLKEYFPAVYSQMRLELMKDYFEQNKSKAPKSVIEEKPIFIENEVEENILCDLSTLPNEHPAYLYCLGRLIPKEKLDRIKYVENYQKYVDEIVPGKYERIPTDERIVFELRDSNKELFGVQGRIIKPGKKNRFLTLKFIDEKPKLYGLDYVNNLLPVIVTEGIIDSFFLDNAIALAGGDVISNLDVILNTSKNNIYIALDNEPRNIDTVNRLKAAINGGYNVYFWDIDTSLKDINEMVKHGYTKESIQQKILAESLSGFKAKMKFQQWKKV